MRVRQGNGPVAGARIADQQLVLDALAGERTQGPRKQLTAVFAVVPLSAWALGREWRWVRAHWMETLAVLIMPAAVIAGFEAAYYTPGVRPQIAEFGRYAFPAIAPLALIAVGALHAFGRRRMLWVGVGALVALMFLSYASQLLTLTAFYA